MKKIYFKTLSIFLVVLAASVFSSCEKDKETEGISKITYFADFKMQGSSEIFLPLGSTFTDPGVKATENNVEIEVKQTITGDYFPATAVDGSAPNKYVITYKATNKDGFDGSAERVVYVVSTGDLVSSIEGLYTSTVVRNGVASAQYTDMAYIMIKKVGANQYEITDGIGGYYDLGRGYGADYRASGVTITDNGGGSYATTADFGVGAFGGKANITGFTVNAGAKTISFVTDWEAGYTFEVTLTQVQL